MQTLISQCLDQNFLNEIFSEAGEGLAGEQDWALTNLSFRRLLCVKHREGGQRHAAEEGQADDEHYVDTEISTRHHDLA